MMNGVDKTKLVLDKGARLQIADYRYGKRDRQADDREHVSTPGLRTVSPPVRSHRHVVSGPAQATGTSAERATGIASRPSISLAPYATSHEASSASRST